MLRTPAPYPHVGSYALYVDTDLPVTQQRAELVRLQRIDSEYILSGAPASVSIAFPLRTGASGFKSVPLDQLLDGTPLDQAERRELADLQRALLGTGGVVGQDGRQIKGLRGRKAKEARAESLRKRAIWSMILESELAKLRSQQSRGQPSIGSRLPLSEVA